jgi:hypothetical protein
VGPRKKSEPIASESREPPEPERCLDPSVFF